MVLMDKLHVQLNELEMIDPFKTLLRQGIRSRIMPLLERGIPKCWSGMGASLKCGSLDHKIKEHPRLNDQVQPQGQNCVPIQKAV